MNNLRFCSFHGNQIAEVIEDIAQLRIEVFKSYPYLYEGTLDYERKYLQTYIDAEKSLLFAVFDDKKMIGATTCIPLEDETDEVQEPFIKAKLDLGSIFYFGESILLKIYRGLGLGHRFFEDRESHAKQYGTYDSTCFCAVQRPESHPLKPTDYIPLDDFWIKRGYQKQAELTSYFEWLDVGEEKPSNKPMIYWSKKL